MALVDPRMSKGVRVFEYHHGAMHVTVVSDACSSPAKVCDSPVAPSKCLPPHRRPSALRNPLPGHGRCWGLAAFEGEGAGAGSRAAGRVLFLFALSALDEAVGLRGGNAWLPLVGDVELTAT